jgi:O-antigen/teichoic acid export membrane protein
VIKRLTQSRFARDAGLLQVSGIFVAVAALFSTVLLSYVLGPEIQGNYFLALAGFGLCYMLLGTGVQQAVVAQFALARGREQFDKAAGWLAFAFKAQVAIGLLLTVTGPIFVVPIVEFVTHEHDLAVLAWWLCVTPILEAPKTMAICALQGGRRMRALALLEMGQESLRVTSIVTAVLIEPSARAAVLGTLVASALSGVVALVAHRREARRPGAYLPSVGAVFAQVREVPLRHGLPLGMRIGLLRSADALSINVLPPLIIKHIGELRGFEQASDWVAYFRVAQRIMQIPVVLLQGISRTALPSLAGLVGQRDPKRFKSLFFKVSLLCGAIVAVGLAVSYPVMLIAVRVWRPDYHDPVSELAGILALALAISGFAGAFDSFYMVAQRLRAAIVIAFTGMIVTLPLAVWFTWLDPRHGIAWGMVAINGWALVHYAYIGSYFARRRHVIEMARSPEATT